MIQQRKKDYLQRLIEEFFAKLHQLTDNREKMSIDEQKSLLADCFRFFDQNFAVIPDCSIDQVVKQVGNLELLDQYAGLLLKEYELSRIKNSELLIKALSLVEYLQNEDSTYSWERTVVREDILRLLSAANP